MGMSIGSCTFHPRALAWLGFALAAQASAQVTSILSLDTNGQASAKDCLGPRISADGRYVGFFSYDNLFVSGSPVLFVHSDTYLRDRVTGALERVSVSSSEVQGDGYSYAPCFSSDVRYVAFASYATNLASGDTNGPYPTGLDVFVRDRANGTTERVSVGAGAAQGNGMSGGPAISSDGTFVAFYSDSSNLVSGDTNGFNDVFVRDRSTGTTVRASVSSSGVGGNGDSWSPAISADGRFVAFFSYADNLVPGDTNLQPDVFVRDRRFGTTECVSVTSGSAPGDDMSIDSVLSPDGRYVVFWSRASNLVSGDTNGVADIFLRDRSNGTTERISVGPGGAQSDGDSALPAITPDGRFVAFYSRGTTLVAGDTNGRRDVFVRDRQTAQTERLSLASNGAQGTADSGVQGISITADGRLVAFDSRASLVEIDSNSWHDVYVRDRDYDALASLCSPGVDGVMACPCSNPPGGPGRGCDNTAGTGGASLSASGVAYLSTDTLVFTTSGQNPTATSIVVQGDALAASGTVFGQGIGCASGALRRLYTKTASGGSITAPDFGSGDPSVHARSAAAGDAIQPGQTRWYLVYYRDLVVHGGCPSTSTFNVTQTGAVVWMP